jgi:16S rRNA (guanine(966)-N(2))-methyltransferase RsmD
MRIIAGDHRGARLLSPEGRTTRPMLDRVRTALFDRLGELGDARVLDLFAGSGSLGLEALSRGAASCCFVESDPRALAALRANVAKLRLGERARIVRGDAFAFVRDVASPSFDLVFVDPPYRVLAGAGRARTLGLLAILRERALASGGVGAFHFPRDRLAPEELALVGRTDLRACGSSSIALFRAP